MALPRTSRRARQLVAALTVAGIVQLLAAAYHGGLRVSGHGINVTRVNPPAVMSPGLVSPKNFVVVSFASGIGG